MKYADKWNKRGALGNETAGAQRWLGRVCRTLMFSLFALCYAHLSPGLAEDRQDIWFSYVPLGGQEVQGIYRRQEAVLSFAPAPDGFSDGPQIQSYRLRFISTQEPSSDGTEYRVTHSTQQARVGETGPWQDQAYTYLPPRGTYLNADNQAIVVVGDDAPVMAPEEKAKLDAFFLGPSFSERMGRYLDGRRLTRGQRNTPDPALGTVIGQADVPVTLELVSVGPRWGREVARFELRFVTSSPNMMRGSWVVDVDVATARTIRAVSHTVTDQPLQMQAADGTVLWRHLMITDELQYSDQTVTLDRSNFELVNPAFLRPHAGSVRDIAALPQNDALVILEDVATDADDAPRQRLGLWDLQAQAVSKVEGVTGASHVFASENAGHILLADIDLSLNSYLLRDRGFTPFSAFLRYPGAEVFSAWDTFGVYSVAGTNTGRLTFVNTGWDQEMGAFQVAQQAMTGVSVLPEERRLAAMDKSGTVYVQQIALVDACNTPAVLERFCDGIEAQLSDPTIYRDVVSPECAEIVGPSLKLLPGRDAIAVAYRPAASECAKTTGVVIIDLGTRDENHVPGDSFVLRSNTTEIVTNFGVFEMNTPGVPTTEFTPPVLDARRIELIEAQSSAFILDQAGKLHLVDLASGAVVDDLTARPGFSTPARVLARTLWQQSFAALMDDGTLVLEHPETGRHQLVDLGKTASLETGTHLLEAHLVGQRDRLLAVLRHQPKNAPWDASSQLSVVAIDGDGMARLVGHLDKSREGDVAVTEDGRLSLLERDSLTGVPLRLVMVDDQELRRSVPFSDVERAQFAGWTAARGVLEGQGVFLTHRFDLAEGRLIPTVRLAPSDAAPVDLPGEFDTLTGSHYPLVADLSGRWVAIANLPPPNDGSWNEYGRIVQVVDVSTGARVAEFFQDWATVTEMSFSPDSRRLALGYDTGTISIHDVPRGIRDVQLEAHAGSISDLRWTEDRLLSRGADGVMRIWEPDFHDLDTRFRETVDDVMGAVLGVPGNEALIATVLDPSWDPSTRAFEGTLAITSDGYYAGDKNSLRHIRFSTGLSRSIDLAEADLHRNRPDIVFERTGLISPKRHQLLSDLHTKRLTESGLGALSTADLGAIAGQEITVTRSGPAITDAAHVRFRIERTASDLETRLYITNNGVRLSDLRLAAGTVEQTVALAPGLNRIRVEHSDSAGRVSVVHRSTVRYQTDAIDTEPRVYVFAAGVSEYDNETLNLTYAAKDARDLAAYFAATSGAIVKTALDGAATRDLVSEARAFFAQARPQDRTIFFFAGHGLLDEDLSFFLGSYETRPEDLAATAISFAELESVFDDTSSLHRVILLDACHSGAVDPGIEVASIAQFDASNVVVRDVRGAFDMMASVEEPVAVDDSYEALRANFLDTRSRSGAHIIAASGGLQFAFERGNVANGLFTHALLSGLRSRAPDSNGDTKINLDELFRYIVGQVTDLSQGRQVPSVRSEPLYGGFVID